MKRMWSLKQIKEFIKGTTKDIATLVDADGHDRFIEGDIDTPTIEGVSFSLAKWSLSGTHLMIVLAGSVANATEIEANTLFGEVKLPDWIKDKLVILFASTYARYTATFWASNYSTQTDAVSLVKTGTKVEFRLNALTLSADRSFRFEFDLYIPA